MASSPNETRTIEIIVKGQQANASIKEMGAAAAIMRNQLEKMAQDDPRRAKLAADYVAIKDRITEARKANEAYGRSQVDLIVNGQKVEASFNEMKLAAGALERQLHELSANDPARAQLLKDYQELRHRIHAVSTEMGTAQKAGGLLRTAFASAVGVFLGGGLLDVAQRLFGFFGQAREEFAASAQAGAQLEATLASTKQAAGLTKKAIEDIAEARAKVTLFDDDDTKGAASLLLTFTNIKDGVFQEALPALQDLSAKMGTDLQSSAVQVGKALNDPIAGISALSRVGVSFTEGQKAVIEKLVETGDVAAAQRIILAELSKEFGGSAEAARTAAGPMATFSMAMGEARETVGELVTDGLNVLAPLLLRLVKGVVLLVDGFRAAPAFVRENKETFVALGTAVLALNAANIAASASALYHTGIEKGRALATRATATAQALLNGAMTANPIGAVIAAVALLVGGFVTLYNKSETVRTGIAGLAEAAKAVFSTIRDVAAKTLGGVGDLLVGMFTFNPAKISAGLTDIKESFSKLGQDAGDAFNRGVQERLRFEAEEKRKASAPSADPAAPATRPGLTPEELAAQAEEERLKKEAADKAEEKAERRREAAARKAEQAREREIKAEQEAGKKLIASLDALEDARIATMEDKRLREIEQINLDARRKARDVVGNEIEMGLQLDAIEAERQERQRAATERYQKEQADLQKKSLDERLQQEDESEQAREAVVQAKFEQALITDEQRDELLYEARKASLERKLALEEQYGSKETKLYRDTLAALAKNEAQHHKDTIANAKKRADALEKINAAGLKFAGDSLAFTIDLLQRDEAARRKNATLIKAFSAGKVVVDGIQEVQAIWKNANSNPGNILFPGFGTALAVAQTALAVARSGLAIKTITTQPFFAGGRTGTGLRATVGAQPMSFDIPGLHVSADGRLKDKTGAAIAGIVHENEWVMPAWMRSQPDIIPIERHLEARRLRGYFEGGPTGAAPLPAMPSPGTAEYNERLIDALDRLNQRLEGVESWQGRLDVVLSIPELERELEKRIRTRLESEIR